MAPAQRPAAGSVDLAGLIARPAPEPGAAFDNLVYVGGAWVSAWVLKTSDGLLLIDALNTVDEANRLIVGGLGLGGPPPSTAPSPAAYAGWAEPAPAVPAAPAAPANTDVADLRRELEALKASMKENVDAAARRRRRGA